MPDLTKLLLHRTAGDFKPKVTRNKDSGTTSVFISKPQGQLLLV